MVRNLGVIVFLLIVSPLFFYKLSQSSLVSWDEAWYGDIARNMIQNKDWFNLTWNGQPFSDKPLGGIWLQAISFQTFGVSEFAVRLPSAIAGILSLLMIYLLGSKLFSKLVGALAALALVSAPWFLYRSRVGDLDIILVLFYLLTVYLAVLTSENKKYLLPFSLALAFLPMIKGLVFIAAVIPTLVVIFWGSKVLKKRDYLMPAFCLSLFFGGWILIQYIHDPNLVTYHFTHSFRNSSSESDVLSNFKIFKEYLHSGIGRWFWPGVLGVGLSFVLCNRKLVALSSFCIFYALQFQFSPRIEIWHLIPMYPFMILAFFGSVYSLINKFSINRIAINILLVGLTLYISLMQLKIMWYQFIDIPSFVSDDAILSREAGKYPYPFYIDSSFEPAAVFYSRKNAKWINEYYLSGLFAQNTPFLLIVKEPMLEKLKVSKGDYKILKSDRDKILILYEPKL